MKNILFTLLLLFVLYSETTAQTDILLDPRQSMLMTGKGPGQDATINPYDGEDCIAIVQNIGEGKFSIRIEQKGKRIQIIPVEKNETKRLKFLKDYELYLDTDSKKLVKARVDYEPIEE